MTPPRRAFLDHPGPIPFAHRGGACEHPENTMLAFAHAVDLGYRYVETDVHTTADGVLVAFHDDVLDRVTDRTGAIADLPWAQVRSARVAGEPIPLLEDLLGEWPDLRVNIDPKHDASVEPLVEALRRTASFDRVCVGAFSEARLRRVRALSGDRLCTAMSPSALAALRVASVVPAVVARPVQATVSRAGRVVADRLGVAGRARGDCAQVPVRQGRVVVVDRRFVDAAHERGLPVHVWTVDDADEMVRLLDLGVDGIMTDRPATLKDVLVARGQWAA